MFDVFENNDFYAMNLEIVVRVIYMFVSRGLPTCKMLIRKNVYSFLTCIARSGNAILQNIMNSDALYTSPLCRHWRKMLYVYINYNY